MLRLKIQRYRNLSSRFARTQLRYIRQALRRKRFLRRRNRAARKYALRGIQIPKSIVFFFKTRVHSASSTRAGKHNLRIKSRRSAATKGLKGLVVNTAVKRWVSATKRTPFSA